MDVGKRSNLSLIGLKLQKYIVKRVRFHTTGEATSPVYDCLVPYDDKSMVTSLESRYDTIRPHRSTTYT